MKKVGSILLSILFFIALLVTIILGIVRTIVKPSTIVDMATEMFKPVAYEKSDNGLFYADEWNYFKTVQYEIPEGIDFSSFDLENLDINEIIQAYGKEYGVDIDSEFIQEILSDPETDVLINTYTNEVLDYISGKSTELNIDPVLLESVVNKSIDKYEAKTGEKFDRTGLSEAIAEGVKSAVPEIESSLDQAKEDYSSEFAILNKVLSILSLKVFIICIAVCVILFILIFVINMNIFMAFRYVSIPGIIDSLLLLAVGFGGGVAIKTVIPIIKASIALSDSILDAALRIVARILKYFTVTGLISLVISVVICVLGFILYKEKAKKTA